MAEIMLQCYNKGCGQNYDPNETTDDACKHHPGYPVFHDALKGWSCCKKRSTDFTEFLNIPGCSFGKHSNEKPEQIQPEVKLNNESKSATNTETNNSQQNSTVTVYDQKEFEKKAQSKPLERPSLSAPKSRLGVTVGATLKQALDKQMKDMNITDSKKESDITKVEIGTSCKNNACKKSYEGESSNVESCIYHPGQPIFHEGMKYWTCCQRKTSDFDNFLAQEGCSTSTHLWIKKEDPGKKVACRYDWHQTAQFVTISVFSKVAIPDQSWIEANGVSVYIHIAFDGGNSVFEKSLVLQGIIDPSRSKVKMLGTKVEINLRKAEPGSWRDLVYSEKKESIEES